MFSIIWVKHGAEIGREPSALSRGDEVVRYARSKAKMKIAGFDGHVPDEFRVIDRTGQEIARQHMMDEPR